MTATEAYYRERAAEARTEADDCALANVRERCLRSAVAWDAMATRIARTTRMRAATEARKAAEHEAAAAIACPAH